MAAPSTICSWPIRYRAVKPQYTPLRRKCSVRCASKLSLLCNARYYERPSFSGTNMQQARHKGRTHLRNLLDVCSMLFHQQRSSGAELCWSCLPARIAFHLTELRRDEKLPTKIRPANRSLQYSLRDVASGTRGVGTKQAVLPLRSQNQKPKIGRLGLKLHPTAA